MRLGMIRQRQINRQRIVGNLEEKLWELVHGRPEHVALGSMLKQSDFIEHLARCLEISFIPLEAVEERVRRFGYADFQIDVKSGKFWGAREVQASYLINAIQQLISENV